MELQGRFGYYSVLAPVGAEYDDSDDDESFYYDDEDPDDGSEAVKGGQALPELDNLAIVG